MKSITERQLKECREHMKPYMKPECTKELREMCANCEKYCGEQHDYDECEDLQCFRFWLAYQYLEWSNSFN